MNITKALYELLNGILIAVIPILTTYAVKWLIATIEESKAKASNANAQKYLQTTQDVITSVVQEVSQTYVSSLKDNGKFDKSAHSEAFSLAFNKAKHLISTEGADVINDLYGDFDTYLRTLIEATVAKLKQ